MEENASVAKTALKPAAAPSTVDQQRTFPSRFPVVGVVASAGGLNAFKKFLEAMPEDSFPETQVFFPTSHPFWKPGQYQNQNRPSVVSSNI